MFSNMAEILLSSEKFIKEVSNISDNLAGKFLLPSLREAQDVKLKMILGDGLLRKLQDLLRSGQIFDNANEWYKRLLDECQYFLAYTTIVEVTNKVSYKIGNAGVKITNDENLQAASQDEIIKQQYYYQAKADAYCYQLQGWILDNKSHFPELTECHCRKIHSNLLSAASCGLFLGGARGKKRR